MYCGLVGKKPPALLAQLYSPSKSIFGMPLVLIPVAWLKEVSIELFRHMMPKLESLIKRMAIVKSGVDACPVSFVLQLADIVVGVSCLRSRAAGAVIRRLLEFA